MTQCSQSIELVDMDDDRLVGGKDATCRCGADLLITFYDMAAAASEAGESETAGSAKESRARGILYFFVIRRLHACATLICV